MPGTRGEMEEGVMIKSNRFYCATGLSSYGDLYCGRLQDHQHQRAVLAFFYNLNFLVVKRGKISARSHLFRSRMKAMDENPEAVIPAGYETVLNESVGVFVFAYV